MQRAYSVLTVKSIEEDHRLIYGIATTPSTDRQGDIVEPLGARFARDLPLLLYHDANQPIGRTRLGKPTAAGIPFEASLPHVPEEGRFKDRVDEAWHMLKHRVITGVSIGFRTFADKVERMKDGGLRFLEFEILELSLVPIPANAEATITSVKGLDRMHASPMRSASPRPGIRLIHASDLF